jgi:prepilin-type processing-associated H-X9-DG protein
VGTLAHLQVFMCPADVPVTPPSASPAVTQGSTSYLGVSGVDKYRLNGVLFTDSRIRMADVRDGSSNTVMVGERPPSRDLAFGRWYGGWGPWGMGNAFLGVRETDVADTFYHCPPGPYRFEKGSVNDPCSIYHFWSFHLGGANFLFVDGSVRFLSYSADSIMPALATRDGGESVSVPD